MTFEKVINVTEKGCLLGDVAIMPYSQNMTV